MNKEPHLIHTLIHERLVGKVTPFNRVFSIDNLHRMLGEVYHI